jgi:opacity protein-like surface antigen
MKSMKRVFTSSVVAVLLATAVYAATALTGKWEGTTGNGAQVVLDLTATETTVAGTLTRNGETFKISDGKVSKNTFTFKVTLNDQPEGLTGELAGDEIKVWMDSRGPDSTVVLKRVKK